MDQLRPSFHGVAPALCDRMDCAHPARVVPCSALRRAIRVHRHCVQRLRARSLSPRRRHTGFRGYAAHGEAPITRCPCELCDRCAGCVRRAAPRVRSDMRRPDSPLAARGRPRHWAGALLHGLHARHCEGSSPPPQKTIPVRLHKSMTSPIGCEQRPFHSMSRGSPTFTDSSRAMSLCSG